MSRAAEKKPVGFATQLTAGGIAGAMEAVGIPPLSRTFTVALIMLVSLFLFLITVSVSLCPPRASKTSFLRAYSYAANHWIPSRSECSCLSPALHPG